MSFELINNNIKITDSSGDTVFDTDTPMPHIIHQASVGVNTPAWNAPLSTNGSYGGTNWSTSPPITPSSQGHTFPIVNEYSMFYASNVADSVNYACYSQWVHRWFFSTCLEPLEATTSKLIATIPTAGLNADFVLVQGKLARLSVWNGLGGVDAPQQDDYGIFQSGIPDIVTTTSSGVTTGTYAGSMSLNGTTLLETVFTGQGEQWLTRTLDIRYVPATATAGGSVYADWKHSNSRWESDKQVALQGGCNSTVPSAAYVLSSISTVSVWDAYYEVFFGKFTL